jgi:type IV secretion system protein VirB9
MRCAALALLSAAASTVVAAGEAQIRSVTYDPTKVINVPVARGVPTHVEFESGEEIVSDVAAGLTSVCRSSTRGSQGSAEMSDAAGDAWDLCAPKKGRDLWIKPIGSSKLPNPVSLRTNRRAYSFNFFVVTSPTLAVQRLSIAAPPSPPPDTQSSEFALRTAAAAQPRPEEVVDARLGALPAVRNSSYDRRTNETGQEACPSAVWDDGIATFMQYRGQRPIPSIHRVNADGSKQQITPRMDRRLGRLLVADQVAPGWELRLGAEANSPVCVLVNQAFDPEGVAIDTGTTSPGVRRVLLAPPADAKD